MKSSYLLIGDILLLLNLCYNQGFIQLYKRFTSDLYSFGIWLVFREYWYRFWNILAKYLYFNGGEN